ncbi:PEP-CTERM sorting domain-containing protein [Rhodopirellula bahusiensis]
MNCRTSSLSFSRYRLILFALLWIACPTHADAAVYSQIADPFYQVINNGAPAGRSQNDLGATGNFLPNFATVYDNFSFGSDLSITNFSWVGAYELDEPGDVLANSFTVSVYENSTGGTLANEPATSAPVFYRETFATALLGESPLTVDGLPFRSYSVDISPLNIVGGQTYWLSVVANVDFADNGWALAFSDLGDDLSVRDFQDNDNVPVLNRTSNSFDFAFSVTAVPEPGTFAALGLTGLIGLAYRRKQQISISKDA